VPASVAVRDWAWLDSLKKKYTSPSFSVRWMYLIGGQAASSLTSGGGSAATTRAVISGVGSSVAKAQVGRAGLGIQESPATTIVGVRPTKMTLPPAAAKARRRSSTPFWITVEVGTITAR
jgi:hypothetical protein